MTRPRLGPRVVIPAGLAVVLVASGLGATPALAAPSRHAPRAARERSVPVHAVASHAARPKALLNWQPSAVHSPSGSATVTVPAGPAAGGSSVQAGSLPVWIGAATGAATAAGKAAGAVAVRGQGASIRLRVTAGSPAAATAAGVTGVLFRIDGLGPANGHDVNLSLGTQAFRDAYGADYASRLRLVTLPACALTTPQVAACQVRTPVVSTDSAATGLVSGAIAAPSEGASVVVAADSTPGGGAGTFTATSLQASGSWQVGGSNGGFEWSYPIDAPNVPGGLSPSVGLSYSSQSVDGLTSATNTQASWIGDGWDYQPGFIERSYPSCDQNPAGPTKTEDNCWSADNSVTISLNGENTVLVKDDTSGQWHPQDDNGEQIQLLTGATNGAYSGEYWVVTDAKGIKYYFGKNQLPGYTTGSTPTNSVYTEPVFATASGQPCYNATFANSYCANMAYRWNLDYVVDPHADVISYFYTPLTGYYARDNGTKATAAYTRGGYLSKAEYGQRDGQVYSTPPAAQIIFTPTGRCNQATCDPKTLSTSTAKNWPDVPYDLNCASGATCSQQSPSFWNEYRLGSIQTQVLVGSTEQNVDRYELETSFPATGDISTPAMWLDTITHTAQSGSAVPAATVTFTGQPLANRVNTTNGYPPLTRRRLQKIVTETGEVIGVDYSSAACASGTPSDPSANTSMCFPSYWTPTGQPDPILDWFNMYVATDVSEQDETSGGLPVKTHYSYQSPAWHRDDSALTPAKYRTWGQWRGFKTVQELTGQAPDTITETQSTYFQGMNGDALKSGGRRTATISDKHGDPAVTDDPTYVGMTYEEVVFNGAGGAITKDTVTTPWQSGATATHTVSGLPSVVAHLSGPGSVRTYTPLADGSTRTTEVDNAYDAFGRTITVNDKGDTSTSTDDKCTRTTYPANTAGQILDAADDVQTTAADCSVNPTPGILISDVRSYFDGSTTFGAAPTKDDTTMVTQVASYTGSTPNYVTTSTSTFDQYGRVKSSTDADNRTTSTAYTPATGAEPTQTTVTDPMDHVTTTVIDPRRDLPTTVTDPAGYVTTKKYDALGRVTAQWNPGQNSTGPASATFAYVVSSTGPSTVTTRTLRRDGSYDTKIQLYDALLRDRETQVSTADGGRIITDTVYNTVGSKVKTSAAYYNSGAPSNTLVVAPDDQVPSQTGYVYDGAGRETAVISYALSHETWRTSYVYGGNFTTVIPLTGGTTTTTFDDARDNSTDIYQYHAGVPIDPIHDPAADYDQIHYGYTPDAQPSSVTDAAGNTWTRSYNLLGQTTSESDPDTGTSTSTYDNESQVLSETDARGKTTSYQYDLDGRRTASYDTTGGVAPSTTNQIAGWTFDTWKVGMPTSSTMYVAGEAYTDAVIGYNAFAKPAGTRVTLPSSEGALAPANGYATAFTYDSVGDVATQTDQAAGDLPQEMITYGRDSSDRSTSVRGIWDYVDNTTYTEFDEVQQYVMGPSTSQVWQTLDYDEQTRALRGSVVGDSTTASVDDLSYAYDKSGNVTSTQDKSPATGTDTQCFSYDYAERLSAAWTGTDGCAATPTPGHSTTVGGPMPYWQSWTFNVAGDRLTQTDHDTGGTVANDTTTTYHYPAVGSGAHRLASTTATGPAAAANTGSLGYDASGNTTSINGGAGGNQILSWDDQGKLATDTTSAGVTKYLYDADGNLLLRKDPGRTTLYLDDEELVLTGSTVTGTRYYSVDDVEVAARTGASTVTYLASDRQNTDTVSVDSATLAVNRRRYTPYGQTRTAPATWPGDVGYVGGTADPTTTLENLGAREYDPALGRFLSSDPVLETADPKEMGGYAYAGNNPVTHSDPSGRMLYDDNTGLGFGNSKVLSHYYHKNKKAVRKIIASRNRSWNIFYHSAYYRWIGSPSYQKAYTKYVRAQYDAITRANYPPKPKPKPHKSFWGKLGHAVKKYTPAALSVVSVVATVAAFTPVCAGVCLGIAAAADATKGALEWSEGNTSGAAWDFAAVATFGAGRYFEVAGKASKLRYFGELGNSNAVRMGLRNKFGAQGAARMMRQNASAFTHYKSLRQAHDLVDGTFTAYNLAINGSVAFNDFYLEGHGGGEGGE